MKPLLALTALLCGFLLVPAAAPAQAVVGKPAPDFSLPGLDGKISSLSAEKGKIVVLEWTDIHCPFVGKHYGSGNIPGLQEKYTLKGVAWFSVCSDSAAHSASAADVAAARAAWSSYAPYLVDLDGAVGRAYGAKTTPHVFIIDKDGVLRYEGAIDSIPSADPADIPKATPYVAEALDALLAGKAVQTAVTPPYGCPVHY